MLNTSFWWRSDLGLLHEDRFGLKRLYKGLHVLGGPYPTVHVVYLGPGWRQSISRGITTKQGILFFCGDFQCSVKTFGVGTGDQN